MPPIRRRRFLELSLTAAAAVGCSSLIHGEAHAATLDMPLYRQQHALTCEAASLRMALGALGLDVDEADILARLARDPTPRIAQSDGSVIWGNPDVGFVGDFDGVFAQDGYGVYDGPIADVALAFGLAGTQHGQGADPADLYAAVSQKHPAVMWIPYGMTVNGRGQWSTPDGETIPYVVTEHCVVLAGLTDTGIIYADPWEGRFKTATYAQFEAALPQIGSRAVVVSA